MTMIARTQHQPRPGMTATPPRQDVLDEIEGVRFLPEFQGSTATTDVSKGAGVPCTRILVADDHEVVRCGLRAILAKRVGWKVVAEASDGQSAIAKAVEMKPDVAIIDDTLPLMNGIEVTRQIRTRSPGTEVLVFATHDSEALVRDFLRAGGRAFLLKSDATHNLFAAVEALIRHKSFFTGNFTETLLGGFLSINEGNSDSLLSPRERAVVQLIAEGHSNKQIGAVLNLSIKTVETHRAAAMRKISVTSTAGLVRYAVRNKWVDA
jgi:DNA-binding NarL/FixJ family response regulator